MPRLARELRRTEAAVRWRLARLGLAVAELRTDLTATQVAEIIGRDIAFVLSRIRRKELAARQQDGAWRIWPSALRDWIRADPERVRWERAAGWVTYLVALLSEEA